MPNFTVKEKNAPSTTSKPDEGPPVRPTTYFSNMAENLGKPSLWANIKDLWY